MDTLTKIIVPAGSAGFWMNLLNQDGAYYGTMDLLFPTIAEDFAVHVQLPSGMAGTPLGDRFMSEHQIEHERERGSWGDIWNQYHTKKFDSVNEAIEFFCNA
jgi:hypothetical protein